MGRLGPHSDNAVTRDTGQLVKVLRSAATSLGQGELLSQYEVFHEEIAVGANCPHRERQHPSSKPGYEPELSLDPNPTSMLRLMTRKQIRVLAKNNHGMGMQLLAGATRP
jgi:hypothetical protein